MKCKAGVMRTVQMSKDSTPSHSSSLLRFNLRRGEKDGKVTE